MTSLWRAAVSALLMAIASCVGATNHPRLEAPEVAVCELRYNPEAWDKKVVRVTGYLTHGFEDSTLVDPACGGFSNGSPIWMEYGGKVGSGTTYFGGPNTRVRVQPIRVQGIEVPLEDDLQFRKLDSALHSTPQHGAAGVAIQATIEGMFFAGQQKPADHGSALAGFGHFGCCTLFVIEKVDRVADGPLSLREITEHAQTFGGILPPPAPAPASLQSARAKRKPQ